MQVARTPGISVATGSARPSPASFDFAKPARIRIYDIGQPLNTEADFLNSPVRDISMGIGSGVLPFNTPGGKTINHRFQFYGADTWKLTNRFTINYGLSYRFDTNLWNHDQGRPASIAPLFGKGTAPSPRDNNNFSPRVGFAWDVAGNGRTVVRGGFGMYYDTTIDNLRLFERADLGKPGSELFLVGADIHSALLPGGDARFGSAPGATGFLTLAQALALVAPYAPTSNRALSIARSRLRSSASGRSRGRSSRPSSRFLIRCSIPLACSVSCPGTWSCRRTSTTARAFMKFSSMTSTSSTTQSADRVFPPPNSTTLFPMPTHLASRLTRHCWCA